METYIKASHIVKKILNENEYDSDVGVNRITDTINVKIRTHGDSTVPKLLPLEMLTLLEDDDEDEIREDYILTIPDEESARDYMTEHYDEEELEELKNTDETEEEETTRS